MSLWTEIHKIAHDHPEGPTWPLAEQYIDGAPREQLVALFADAIATMRRHEVRNIEQEAFTPLPLEVTDIEGFEEHLTDVVAARPPVKIPREQFIELLDRSFAIGRHLRVRWGEATVEQHQQRVEMLGKQVSGLEATINRHLQAIAVIEEEGVSCLDEAIRPAPATEPEPPSEGAELR